MLLGLGELERTLGRNDQAREAYGEARTLFKAVGDRLGEANVLLGLGDLEAESYPELAKRHYYQAAHIYEAVGQMDWREIAIEKAEKLSG